MKMTSLGDISLNYQQRLQNARIKSDLGRLTQELSSGRRTDLSTVATGDYSSIVSMEHSLTSAKAFATAIGEAGLLASTQQSVLEMVQRTSSDLGPALFTASSSGQAQFLEATVTDAEVKFDGVISALNTRIGERSTFAGAATDSPALADAGAIIAALQAAVAAETTATGVEAVVDNWFFAAGGGFETLGYQGSDQAIGSFRLSITDTERIALTATDPAIRSTLKGFAMAVLSGGGRSALPPAERLALARGAGEQLLSSDSDLAVTRSAIGSSEARIDGAKARNAAETSALQIARAEIVSIDPYQKATELEAVQTQLETLYTLTARLSRLSLAEFLR